MHVLCTFSIDDFANTRKVVHAPNNLDIGKVDCSIAACHNIQFKGVKLLDAQKPQSIKCTGVHGKENNVDPGAWRNGCVTEAAGKSAHTGAAGL